jgi:hypothetical protein
MNIVIKLISVVSLVLAPWFVRVHGLAVSDAGSADVWRELVAWLPFLG